jgi:prolipoprotein diacylglyceryltransferase
LELPGSTLLFLRIEAFGVALSLGLLLGVLLSARLAERALLDRAAGADALVFALVFGFFGARLLFVLENAGSTSFREALSLGHGGFSAYGAFFFAAVAAWYSLRRQGQPTSAWLDVAAPGALLAAAVARLGSHLGAGDVGRPLKEGSPAWLSRLG